jgi:Xaa-Pro aminopeptidase
MGTVRLSTRWQGIWGQRVSERAERLAREIAETDLDLLLVTHPVNVSYLTGFTGTNGACLVGPQTRQFLTDFRYRERAVEEIDGWDVEILDGDWLAALAGHLKGRTGVEDHHLTVSSWKRLRDGLATGTELVDSGPMVEGLRRIKSEAEVVAIAAAAELGDAILTEVLEMGLVGRSEAEVAGNIVSRMREEGAEPSFLPIVASGPNGASPHAEPGPRLIESGELVTLDLGAELDGYCSDCTRTVATGPLGEAETGAYAAALEANVKALEAVRPGISCRELDGVAREVIEAAGYGPDFGHGLGHGVGLEVHEAPRVGPRSEDSLRTGDVITIEPGIYRTGAFGLRIEDLIVVGGDGVARNLSSHTKALTEIS